MFRHASLISPQSIAMSYPADIIISLPSNAWIKPGRGQKVPPGVSKSAPWLFESAPGLLRQKRVVFKYKLFY